MRLIILLCLALLVLAQPAQGQDSTAATGGTVTEAELQALLDDVETLRTMSEHNIEMAGKIVDWSAMFFAAITLVTIIAGALGLREFANIKAVREELRLLNEEMEKEIESLQEFKEQFAGELESLKQTISQESTDIIKIAYLSSEGTLYFQSGELSRAINAFSEILRINPDDYDSTCYLARCYIGQGRYSRAIETANAAIGMNSRPDRGYRILGEAYRLMERYDLSIEALQQSLKLIPRRSTFNSLAYSYLKGGDLENAHQYFLESLARRRGSTATCGLAKVFVKKRDRERAQSYAQETVKLAEEEIHRGVLYLWPYYSISFAFLILGDEGACLDYLDTSLQKNKNPALNREMLADLTLMVGEQLLPQGLVQECIDRFLAEEGS